jgi:hypothetical protein
LGGVRKDKEDKPFEPGILQYGLANLDASKIKSMTVEYIFEEYYNVMTFSAANGNIQQLTGNIHILHSNVVVNSKPIIGVKTINNNYIAILDHVKIPFVDETVGSPVTSLSSEQIKHNIKELAGKIKYSSDIDKLAPLLDEIKKYRIKIGRIKKTLNNDESSRSHLYITFKVTFTNDTSAYITVIDLAGREDPINIKQTYFTDQFHFNQVRYLNRDNVQPFLKPSIEVTALDILKEGIYINESINNMKHFFQQKIGQKSKKNIMNLNDYEPSYFIINEGPMSFYHSYTLPLKGPKEQEQKLLNDLKKIPLPTFSTDARARIPTQNVLDFLDKVLPKARYIHSEEEIVYKPTKFIMICAVRQEGKYCDDIVKTLQFAKEIKST